jgi:hypothetical protein
LRQKLEQQWRDEIHQVEEERVETFKIYETSRRELAEIELELRRYMIEDQNYVVDRWSLDSQLYYKK